MESTFNLYNKCLSYLRISENQLDELKKANLELFQKFHDTCEENGIRYSMAYGTMLGAIRHKGYIPWDDDIDVVMLREDYNKLCSIMLDNEKYYIRNRDTDKYCSLTFGKFTKKDTVLTEFQTDGVPQKYGIFIDIFPLDYMPNNKFVRNFRKTISTLGARCASLVNDFKYPSKTILSVMKENKTIKKRYNLRRFLGFFASILPLKFWTWLTLKADVYNKPTDTLWVGVGHATFPKCEFENLSLYKYENKKFYGFTNYDKYLSEAYGDYMQLPPEEDRTSHMYVELKLN